jgi:hypothetical protein
LFSITEE